MSKFSFPMLLELSHSSVEKSLKRLTPLLIRVDKEKAFSPLFIDGTCGNGYDSLFLCSELHKIALKEKNFSAQLLSFDVQESALASAKKRLQEFLEQEAFNRISFIHKGHEHVGSYIEKNRGIGIAMYNLGFLPGSDKEIITKAETTIASLEAVAISMVKQGLLSVHSYAGHEGGKQEQKAVDAWFSSLPEDTWTVAKYHYCNKTKNPEALYLAEKKHN